MSALVSLFKHLETGRETGSTISWNAVLWTIRSVIADTA